MPIKQSIIERMELNAEDVKHSHTILYKRKGLYFFKNNIFLWFLVFHHIHFLTARYIESYIFSFYISKM